MLCGAVQCGAVQAEKGRWWRGKSSKVQPHGSDPAARAALAPRLGSSPAGPVGRCRGACQYPSLAHTCRLCQPHEAGPGALTRPPRGSCRSRHGQQVPPAPPPLLRPKLPEEQTEVALVLGAATPVQIPRVLPINVDAALMGRGQEGLFAGTGGRAKEVWGDRKRWRGCKGAQRFAEARPGVACTRWRGRVPEGSCMRMPTGPARVAALPGAPCSAGRHNMGPRVGSRPGIQCMPVRRPAQRDARTRQSRIGRARPLFCL